MKLTSLRTIRLDQGNEDLKKEEIRQYFLNTCELEDRLFSLLKNDEAFYQRPEPLRHPLVFYYGHTHAFFVNKLYVAKLIPERLNPQLESMVAIGVDEMSWDDLNEAHYDWPTVSDLRQYRQQVRDLVLDFIDKTPLTVPIHWESPFWIVLMGIEHQRIHLETSSVLIRQLDLNWIHPQDEWSPCSLRGPAPQNRLLSVCAGEVCVGKARDHHFYGWDNEYGTHNVTLKAFEASEYLVSNGEFLQFVEDQGYQQECYWSSEGWKWKQFKKVQRPYFWRQGESSMTLRTLEREIPLPENWPVETNYYEAQAFCTWKSEKEGKNYRLPTEDEWRLLYQQEEVADVLDWPHSAPGNLNLEDGPSSCPVDRYKFKSFYDVVGNVWQWTETPMYPYDGFQVHEVYDDFTVPTFDHKHHLFKGGSWISTGNEATQHARYAFRKHFVQHAGFRYVVSENPVDVTNNPYETDSLLSQYCEFHYGDSYFNVENFPKSCINALREHLSQLPQTDRALDIGCAVGRSTFELARYFNEAVGIDFSARFIEKAQKFADSGVLRYALQSEGDLQDFFERSLIDLDLVETANRVQFFQGDACNLNKKYGSFDLVFAGNLIDRLYSPKTFLNSIGEFLNPHGLLVLTSPYTWLEEYTPKKEWIGGFKRAGENVTTRQGLLEVLGAEYQLLAEPQPVPFVIRETARKHQHTVADMTIWQKRV